MSTVKAICNFEYQGMKYKQGSLINGFGNPDIAFLEKCEAVEVVENNTVEAPAVEAQPVEPNGFPEAAQPVEAQPVNEPVEQ